MTTPRLFEQPDIYLILAAFLLAAGMFGLIRRRTLIGMLISGELIFSAASLNFVAFNHFRAPDPTVGQVFVLFIMGLAAAEVAIALASSRPIAITARSNHELAELKDNMERTEDIRLLLVTSLLSAWPVSASGKRPNLREAISFLSLPLSLNHAS